jgi:general L-amino acid transport system ATP-binding protein
MSEAQMKVSDEIAISIENMNKWYGTFHVLRDINLDVQRGERIVICGPSGSGKSTLIRCINALEEHQQGIHNSRWDAVVLRCEEHRQGTL